MANQIASKIADISKLSFHPLPTRPTKTVKAMRVQGAHVFIDDKGRIYTSQASNYSFWTTTKRFASTVKALIAMGVLTKEAIEQHDAAEAAEKTRQAKRWAASSVLENIEATGVKFTSRQISQLEKLASREVE